MNGSILPLTSWENVFGIKLQVKTKQYESL